MTAKFGGRDFEQPFFLSRFITWHTRWTENEEELHVVNAQETVI